MRPGVRGLREAHLPDVIELPVEDTHGLSIGVSLDAAPVGCGSLVAARLHHLHSTNDKVEATASY